MSGFSGGGGGASGPVSLAAMAVHNVVVNPAVDISQELGTTGATLVNNTAKYTADQWAAMYNHGAATAVVTSAQITSGSFGSALAGFQFGHQIKATTAITSPANGDFAVHRQRIEGYRVAHWGWGASGAAAIVVAFQLYATASGVALVRLSNSAADRFYYREITVAAGWNFYSFAVAGDTSGTWLKDSGIGLNFEVFVSGKETTPGSSFSTWGATAKIQTTNSTNLLGTNNNLTVLTGVYIDIGTQLPVTADMPGLMRSFDADMQFCKRYLEKSYPYASSPGAASVGGPAAKIVPSNTVIAAQDYGSISFTATKRIIPTMTLYGFAGTATTVSNPSGIDLAAASGTATGVGENSFNTRNSSGGSVTTTNFEVIYHWVADCRFAA